LAAGKGALKEKGEGWLKVEGLLGAGDPGAVTKSEGGAAGVGVPNENGVAVVVGVAAPVPPKENPPPVLGCCGSPDLEGPNEKGADTAGVGTVGVAEGVAPKVKADFGSSTLAGEKGFAEVGAPNENPVDVGGTAVLI